MLLGRMPARAYCRQRAHARSPTLLPRHALHYPRRPVRGAVAPRALRVQVVCLARDPVRGANAPRVAGYRRFWLAGWNPPIAILRSGLGLDLNQVSRTRGKPNVWSGSLGNTTKPAFRYTPTRAVLALVYSRRRPRGARLDRWGSVEERVLAGRQSAEN